MVQAREGQAEDLGRDDLQDEATAEVVDVVRRMLANPRRTRR